MDKGYTLAVGLFCGWPDGILVMLIAIQLSGLYNKVKSHVGLTQNAIVPGLLIGLSYHLTGYYLNSFFLSTCIMVVLQFIVIMHVVSESFNGAGPLVLFTGFVQLIVHGMTWGGWYMVSLLLQSLCPDGGTLIDNQTARMIAFWWFVNIPLSNFFLLILHNNIVASKWFNKIEED